MSACWLPPTSRWSKIKDGSFREDLYYRLNVIAINLPGLRERRDDIPLLVAHFLKDKLSPRTGQPIFITRQALQALAAHDWPGNVRELENAIERAATLCEGNIIQLRDLPPALIPASARGNDAASGTGDIAELPATGARPVKSSAGGSGTIRAFARRRLGEQPAVEGLFAGAGGDLPEPGPGAERGDKERTAIQLGVSLATLYRKLSEDERV